MLDKLSQVSNKAIQGLRVRSALNPALWPAALVTLPALLVALASDNDLITIVALTLAALPVLIACGGFVYFLLRAPERLQSEDYQFYFRRFAEIWTSGKKTSAAQTAFSRLWLDVADQLDDKDPGRDATADPAEFIHLAQAKYVFGTKLVPTDAGMLWRGRISKVYCFSIGYLQEGGE